jgi:hypothetical protein
MTNDEILALAARINAGDDAAIDSIKDLSQAAVPLMVMAIKVLANGRYFISTDSMNTVERSRAFAQENGWGVQIMPAEYHPLSRWMTEWSGEERYNLLITAKATT